MKAPDDSQTEAFVRSMHWRPLTEEVRAASLAVALSACQPPAVIPKASLHRRVISVVPWPVRWTLAACWTLSLGFRLATPVSPGAQTPVVAFNSAASSGRTLPLFASLQQTSQILHELQLDVKSSQLR